MKERTKGLLKRVFSVIMALIMVIGLMTIEIPLKAQAETGDWMLAPSDHTPVTGVELPTNVTALKKIDFSGADYQHSSSSGATTEDNMLVVGEDKYSAQLLYSSQVTPGTVYVLSFYVWTVGEDAVFDLHFEDAGSPSGTGGNYAYNVLKEWKTTHSAYITSCTVDGVETTGSITGATGGWKKVEVEWTPKASGNVLIELGDYGNQSNVTGTIYIDDLAVYAKQTEIYTDYGIYFLGSAPMAINNVAQEIKDKNGVIYDGKVEVDGVEKAIVIQESGDNLVITSGCNQDSGTTIRFAKGTRFTSRDGTTVIVLNHDLSYTRSSSGYGSSCWTENATTYTIETEVKRFESTSGLVAFTYVNTDIAEKITNNTVFTGNLKIDGTKESVLWIKSGANFVIRRSGEAANLTDAGITTLQADKGTELTDSSGNVITITKTVKYSKASGSWTMVPWNHTPETGVEMPMNVTALKKIDFSGTNYQHSSSKNSTTEDNMLVVGEDKYSAQLLYSSQVTPGTVYVLSFYVWTVGDDAVFDLHFDDAGSPSGTGGNYAYNVLQEWNTTHSAYITSCTIDGAETTGSITGATGGWKKVEVEWTPKAAGNVLIELGDYGGRSNVTGTIYIDDLAVYAKQTEIYTDYGIYFLSSKVMAINNVAQEIKDKNGVIYDGKVEVDGVEKAIVIQESGDNLVITSGCDQDSGTTIRFAKGTRFTSRDGTTVIVLNHDLSYTRSSSGYGGSCWTKNTTACTTEIELYKISSTLTAYTYTADLLNSFPNGSTFTGNITVDGVEQSVTWTLSDACLIPAGILDDGAITSIEVVRGTKLTGTYGTITIDNGLKYVKNTAASVSTTIGWYKVNASGQLLLNGIDSTALNDAGFVGDTFKGTILFNGVAQDVTWRVDSNLIVITDNIANYGDVSSIEVSSGTVLTNNDGSGETIIITNGLKRIKINDVWYEDTERAEVTFSYTFETVADTKQIRYKIVDATGFVDDNTASGMRGWYTAIVQIGGVDTSVNLHLGDGYCTFGNKDASGDAIIAAVENSTSITIPKTITLVKGDAYVITLNFTEVQNILKLGQGWAMCTKEYTYPNGNTLYYNIDNGSKYTLTSSNNAIAVEEDPGLTTGSTISKVGTYHVSRIENETLYREIIVLYKHGDVDESNDIDVRDLVAMKWAQAGTSEKQNGRLAGNYAADLDRNGQVDDTDLLALRQALVCGYDIMITNELTIASDGSNWTASTGAETADASGELPTTLTFYKMIGSSGSECAAFTYSNSDIKALDDGAAFTGNILLNGEKYTTTWKKSGDCLMTPNIHDIAGKTVTTVGVEAGTNLAYTGDAAATRLTVSKGNSVLNGEMPIAGFSTPVAETYITEDWYREIAEAGFNTIAYCGNAYYSELTEKHLELAEQFGLKMYVTDSLLTNQTTNAALAARVGKYSMYHSFTGLHIVDEPSYGIYQNTLDDGRPIANYKTAISLCNKTANINGYMNLYPYYSDYTSSSGSATTANYKEYLANTFKNTGAEVLSYDHYAIRAGEKNWFDAWITGQSFKKTVKEADFYTNLEMARAQVKGTGKPFWAFAQVGYPLTANGTVGEAIRVTPAEQQWEINAALAMGAKGVQYYQLFQSASYAGSDGDYGRSGLFGANGQKNTNYYNAAKELNAFIAVIDEVLMNADNEGVIVNDSKASGALSNSVKLSGYHELSGVTGANAMIGCFDYFGKTALLLVNCNTGSAQDITLNFNKTCKAYVTKMGDTEVNRTNATEAASTTINVGAGQSALVIIE